MIFNSFYALYDLIPVPVSVGLGGFQYRQFRTTCFGYVGPCRDTLPVFRPCGHKDRERCHIPPASGLGDIQ